MFQEMAKSLKIFATQSRDSKFRYKHNMLDVIFYLLLTSVPWKIMYAYWPPKWLKDEICRLRERHCLRGAMWRVICDSYSYLAP